MKKLLLIVGVILLAYNTSYSQDISGDQNWKSAKDFRKVEDKIIKNILWLESNPNIENDNNTKAVAAYVLKWLIDCPYITVNIDVDFTAEITSSSYEYASNISIAFMFGKALYAIENQDNKSNDLDATVRGIVGMVNVYKAIKTAKGDAANNESLEKLKKLNDEGKLKEYVENKLKESKNK
jgi:hypothetical protein